MAWTKVATVVAVEPGDMLQVEIDDELLTLYHTTNDKWYVTSDVCTHAGESLASGSLDGCVVACPKHGGKFDVTTGKAVAMPCVIPVETFPVEVRDGDVYVDFE